jgi:predicted cytidylate kinase
MNPIITISGTPGSGKSTIAQSLLEKIKAQRIYTGGLWRDLAKDKNMTLEEFREYAANNPKVDIDLDEKVADQARQLAKESIVIVEGRVQFHFIPESIKIFIKADIAETAKRVWKEISDSKSEVRKGEANVKSLEEMEIKQQERRNSDIERYKDTYKIDYSEESQYDFILDTTNISAEESTEKVLDFINAQI